MGREHGRAKVRSRVVISALGRRGPRPSRVPAPAPGRLRSKKGLPNDYNPQSPSIFVTFAAFCAHPLFLLGAGWARKAR